MSVPDSIIKRGYEDKPYVPKGIEVTPRIEVIGVTGTQYVGACKNGHLRMVDWELFHGDSATVVKSYTKKIKGYIEILAVSLRLENGTIVYGVPASKLQKVEK